MDFPRQSAISYLFAGLYAWAVSAFFGAILLDVAYARVVSAALPASQARAASADVADLLLLVGALAILLAVAAIAGAWGGAPARNLLIASVLCLLATEFLVPILFVSIIQRLQAALGPGVGPVVRLIGSALSSLLAFAGLWKLRTPAYNSDR